jgi:hypothetical protein
MKLYYWLLLILVSGTGVLSALDFYQNKADTRRSLEPRREIYYFSELFKTTVENEVLELNNPVVYKGNNTADKFDFFDIVQDKCLVFRFSGEACNICIDFVINRLKLSFKDFYNNDRIILVGSNINDRVKESYYGKQIISFCSEDLGLPYEKYNTPFLFIVDRDRICKMIFIPEKSLPELTDLYLNTIIGRYFADLK